MADALIALYPVPVAVMREGRSLRTPLECQRKVLLARNVPGRRVKEFVSKSDYLTSFATIKSTLRRFM